MAFPYFTSFEDENTGDLNGQDSWTGSTEYDVQNSEASEGTQGVSVVADNGGGDYTISRAITNSSSGTVYYSYKQSAVSGDDERVGFQLDEAGTVMCWVRTNPSGSGKIECRQGGSWTEIQATSSADTWYRIGIEYDCGTDQYRCNVDDGTWTSLGDFSASNTATNIDGIILVVERNATYTAYYDHISANFTEPSPSFSPSLSPSISPSQSPSASFSPSLSPSLSPSISPSQSPSASFSPSLSPSVSPSQSPSASFSPSLSPSFSPSISPSISPSQSPSASLSPSISPSQSPSASLSPSLSPSISPSPSWAQRTEPTTNWTDISRQASTSWTDRTSPTTNWTDRTPPTTP